MIEGKIEKQTALEALNAIHERLWEIDIPSPTCPEYVEHHEGVQSVMQVVKAWKTKIEKMPDAQQKRMIGKWQKKPGIYMSPGGTPAYICGSCGGSEHLHGVEFPRRKVICDNCGRVNIYPWENAYEQWSSLWEE